MSLLKIAVEKFPPSQRSSLERDIQLRFLLFVFYVYLSVVALLKGMHAENSHIVFCPVNLVCVLISLNLTDYRQSQAGASPVSPSVGT